MTNNAAMVKMGVCNLTFGGIDLGFTKGFVKLSYSLESVEKEVDQMDTPIDEMVTKQMVVVTVPMAEQNFAIFKDLIPGAVLATDGTDPTRQRLILSGAAGASLGSLGKPLVITPVGGNDNDIVTLFKGIPVVNWDITYDKDNVRVYNVEFKATPDDTKKWVAFGDPSVPDPVG